MDKKQCHKCQEWKDKSEFHKNKEKKDGLSHCCKTCFSAYHAAYHVSHRDKCNARSAAYRAENREKSLEYAKEYRAANRETIRIKNRKYRDDHIEECKARDIAYSLAHRDKRRAYYSQYDAINSEKRKAYKRAHRAESAARSRRRRAWERGNGGAHTAEDVLRQGNMQKWKCWWCGKKCQKKYHVDHLVPLAKGGHNNPDNLVISCPHCNQSKKDRLPEDWAGRLL